MPNKNINQTNLTPDEAAASLAFSTKLVQDMLMSPTNTKEVGNPPHTQNAMPDMLPPESSVALPEPQGGAEMPEMKEMPMENHDKKMSEMEKQMGEMKERMNKMESKDHMEEMKTMIKEAVKEVLDEAKK